MIFFIDQMIESSVAELLNLYHCRSQQDLSLSVCLSVRLALQLYVCLSVWRRMWDVVLCCECCCYTNLLYNYSLKKHFVLSLFIYLTHTLKSCDTKSVLLMKDVQHIKSTKLLFYNKNRFTWLLQKRMSLKRCFAHGMVKYLQMDRDTEMCVKSKQSFCD